MYKTSTDPNWTEAFLEIESSINNKDYILTGDSLQKDNFFYTIPLIKSMFENFDLVNYPIGVETVDIFLSNFIIGVADCPKCISGLTAEFKQAFACQTADIANLAEVKELIVDWIQANHNDH